MNYWYKHTNIFQQNRQTRSVITNNFANCSMSITQRTTELMTQQDMQSWICIAQRTPSLNIQNVVCTLVNWLGSITRGSAMKWLWRRNKLNTFYSLSAGYMLMTLLLRWLSCIMLCMYMCIYHTQARNASTHVFVNVYTVYTYGFRGNLEKKLDYDSPDLQLCCMTLTVFGWFEFIRLLSVYQCIQRA